MICIIFLNFLIIFTNIIHVDKIQDSRFKIQDYFIQQKNNINIQKIEKYMKIKNYEFNINLIRHM